MSPDPATTVDRLTSRAFALRELLTPQIDQLEESRSCRDLIPHVLMVEGVGPCSHKQTVSRGHRYPRRSMAAGLGN